MTDEPLTRDRTLGDALAEANGHPIDAHVDWTALERAVAARASFELMRRRARRRMRVAIPAGLAAAIALVAFLTRPAEQTAIVNAPGLQQQSSIDELLDANVSDGQFRALVSGAGEANELLSIAAGEVQQ